MSTHVSFHSMINSCCLSCPLKPPLQTPPPRLRHSRASILSSTAAFHTCVIPDMCPCSAARASQCAADAGGAQGTDGDMSMGNPHAHPKNQDALRAAPPELPAQDLKQYRQAVLSLLQPGETIPAALRWGFVTCITLSRLIR